MSCRPGTNNVSWIQICVELLRESVMVPMPMAVRLVESSPRITWCELQEGKGIKDEKRE